MGVISVKLPRMHVKSGHYRSVSETPSEWRFAGGPIVARDWILAGFTLGSYIKQKQANLWRMVTINMNGQSYACIIKQTG